MKSALLIVSLIACLISVGQSQAPNFSSDLVFDADFYLEKQPDVRQFYGGDKKAALVHWLGDGIKQGRDASPVFSMKYYMGRYPDVPQKNRDAVAHWLTVGVAEGRQGAEHFDPKIYAASIKGRIPNPTYAQVIRHYLSLPPDKRRAVVEVAPVAKTPLPPIGTVGVVKGTFFCDIDDIGTISVNGINIHKAGTGPSRSKEVELRPGDRLVIQLTNTALPRYCKILFVSSDKRQMISFANNHLKILSDPDLNDFDAAILAKSSKFAKKVKSDKNPFPYRNQSDYMWGEMDVCALGAVISKEMFVPLKL